MEGLRKVITLLTILALFGSCGNTLSAEEYYYEDEDHSAGCAYEHSCYPSYVKPTIALGAAAIVVIAIIATRHGHGSKHRSSTSTSFHSH